MALTKAEQERRERNAQNVETLKGLLTELETMELPALNGSPKQIEIGEAKRQKFVDSVKDSAERTIKNGVKNGTGFAIDYTQEEIKLLKTRTTASRW